MNTSDENLRVIIAVTETTPVLELWRTAMQAIGASRAEVVAVFLHDERWQRAASLPFTREISAAGRVADFTLQRANQVLSESVLKMQQRIEQLAAEADVAINFRVVPESDSSLPQIVVGKGRNVFIAPSFLAERPFYAALAALDMRILLVEADPGES